MINYAHYIKMIFFNLVQRLLSTLLSFQLMVNGADGALTRLVLNHVQVGFKQEQGNATILFLLELVEIVLVKGNRQ